MVEQDVLDQVYEERDGYKIIDMWNALRSTLLQRSEELDAERYRDEVFGVDSINDFSREQVEQVFMEYMEEHDLVYMGTKYEIMDDILDIDEDDLDEETAKLLIVEDDWDKLDLGSESPDEQSETMCPYCGDSMSDEEFYSGHVHECPENNAPNDSDSLGLEDETVEVLDAIVEKSNNADDRAGAVDVAVECYQPFLNDQVMTALREIGRVLLQDDDTPQVQEGTEAEIVRYALTALIHTFNQEAKRQGAQEPAPDAAQEVQNNGR